MVRNDVWRASGLHRGLLCVGCLEGRIGRQLHQQDFKDVETNRPGTFPQSLRLRTRLRTPAPADEQSNSEPAMTGMQRVAERTGETNYSRWLPGDAVDIRANRVCRRRCWRDRALTDLRRTL